MLINVPLVERAVGVEKAAAPAGDDVKSSVSASTFGDDQGLLEDKLLLRRITHGAHARKGFHFSIVTGATLVVDLSY
jgi:hypothetical protein